MYFLINVEFDLFVVCYVEEYGMGVCVIGLCVVNVWCVFECVIQFGVWVFEGEKVGVGELKILVIQGIGDLYLYFVDCWCGWDGQCGGVGDILIFDIDFWLIDIVIVYIDFDCVGVGLQQVDYFM